MTLTKPQRGGKRKGAGRKPLPAALVMWYLRVPQELKQKLQAIPAEELRSKLSKLVAPRN